MTIPIKKITMRKLKMKLNHPFKTSFGTVKDKEFFILEATDHDGNRGYGESVAFSTPWYTEETTKTTEHIITDFLIKILRENEFTHPDELSALFAPIRGNNMAKAAIEGAIWDLYAKREKMTLAKALGGTKTEIEVGISLGMEPTIEQLLVRIDSYIQQGFKRVKLKIGPGNDIELLREVRATFPNLPLMADANSAYTLDDIDHLKQLDQFNLMMIEQPLAHDDIVDHAKLQQAIETPICLDESIHSLADTRKAIELGSCKIINIKIGRVGGLTEAKRIHDFCLANDIEAWCGGMLEAGVGRAHNIALTTLAQFTLPGDTAGSSHYWKEDIIKPEVTVERGVIHLPNKSGIGYDINMETLNKFTINKRTFQFE